METPQDYHLGDDEYVIATAAFNPIVKTYLFWYIFFFMFITVIGIPVALVWALGWGQWYSRKFYEKMWCVLTNRNLRLRNGLIIQIEKTIPLENIQDLTFLEGPVLKAWNLSMIKVETAGSSHQYGSQMRLIGVIDAHQFRGKVLSQRSLSRQNNGGASVSQDTILAEIRDLLKEIKEELQKRPV
jgi:putative membrane protein